MGANHLLLNPVCRHAEQLEALAKIVGWPDLPEGAEADGVVAGRREPSPPRIDGQPQPLERRHAEDRRGDVTDESVAGASRSPIRKIAVPASSLTRACPRA